VVLGSIPRDLAIRRIFFAVTPRMFVLPRLTARVFLFFPLATLFGVVDPVEGVPVPLILGHGD